jgi:toxin ParE1/3/4
MICRTTRRCDQDIIDIYVRGAAEFGLDHSERYHEGLTRTFELLALNPRMARLCDETTPPVRLHHYQSHLIAYVEYGEGILILRVLHGRQGWDRHLA